MINFIKEIETKYHVSSITLNGTQVWPFLRAAYYSKYGDCYNFDMPNKNRSKDIFAKLKKAKNVVYGLDSLFRKYDYLVFSDTLERRLVNGKHIDKIAEFLISELGEERVLFIENPVNGLHFNRSKISTQNIVSLDLFCIFCYLPLLRKKLIINSEAILKEINEKYKLDVNYCMLILEFICYKNLFRFFYKIYKPKAIFINCYYSLIHQAAIYTAKKMSIKTIELQHGVINNKCPAYNVFCKLDKSFFPDYLLCFGDYVKNVFIGNNYFISQENIFAVGNGYIEYIDKFYKGNDVLLSTIKKYKKSVAITLQRTVEDKLINFIKETAIKSDNILYIFIPRDLNKDYSNINFPLNVIIFKNLDFYKIVKYVDFHSTVYSTCALEAPALGTPNILINIDNLAKKHYADILNDKEVTKFINSKDEFVKTIMNWNREDSLEIKRRHSKFYKQNHTENIRIALNKIFKVIRIKSNTNGMGGFDEF